MANRKIGDVEAKRVKRCQERYEQGETQQEEDLLTVGAIESETVPQL